MKLNKFILCSAVLFGSLTCALAQPGSTKVYFRTGSAVLDTAYRSNGRTLDAFVRGVNEVMRDGETVVESVTVETGASPEGGVDLNERLAMDRAKTLRSYLLDRLPLNASQVKAFSIGADWEGLNSEIRDSDCPYKDEVLAVIAQTGVRTTSDNRTKAGAIAKLKAIDGGKAWAWMLDNVFAELRQGAGTLRCIVSRTENAVSVRDTLVIIHEYEGPDEEWFIRQAARTAEQRVLKSMEKKPRRFAMDSLFRVPIVAVRTNALLPLLNAGVEVPLGNRWSVSADIYYPWAWRPLMNTVMPNYSTCIQVLYGTVEGRCWLGEGHNGNKADYARYRLAGHSVGLVAGGGYYDLEKDNAGVQGEFAVVGIDYMYALPLGKGNVRLEFNLGFGVAYTGWRGYGVHQENGPLVGNYDDEPGRFIPVPVKAAVNVVIPIYGFTFRETKNR